MSELEDAIARLEAAVARLEAAANAAKRAAEGERTEDDQTRAVAAVIAGRVDAALAKLGQLLEREG